MDLNQSSLSNLKSNKLGITRSVSENKALADAAKAREASSTGQTSNAKQLEPKEGQVLKGQVIDLRYNEIKIQLDPGKQIVTAKLSGDISLSIGQEAQFQVTEQSGDKLVLKYMPDASTTVIDATVQKALTASGFPLTDRNKTIVEELLNHTLPIDKQTLQNLIKLSHTNREASPLTLVLMYKNNIPMTPANIRQFEAYQNGTNQLLSGIHSISKNLVALLDSSSQNAASAETIINNSNSLPVVTSNNSSMSNPDIIMNSNASDASIYLPSAKGQITSSSPMEQVLQVNDKLLSILYNKDSNGSNLNTQQMNIETYHLEATSPNSTPRKSELSSPSYMLNPSIITEEQQIAMGEGTYEDSLPLYQVLSSEEQLSLYDYLSKLPDSESMKSQITTNAATVKEILTFLQERLPQSDQLAAKELLASGEYQKLLEEAFHQKWTITPEKLSRKEAVENLYQSLHEDMEKLSLLTKSIPSSEQTQELTKPMNNLQENLHFMKDLNEMFTYLQLPLQLKDQDVHSELYVYTRKKSLHEKENLSVLLHLDMDHLGSLNIHIQMDHNIITTKFYLADSQGEQVVTQYMPSLSEALAKKGYNLHSEVINTYEKPDFCKDFIEADLEDSSAKRYTFDIRT